MKGLVLLSVIAVSLPCRADRTAAKAAYERGLKQYNLGDYQASLDSFTVAYTEVPDPRLLFNLAQCSRMLGLKSKAVTLYRSYLREIGSDAPNGEEVRRLIAILESDIAREQAAKQAPPQGAEPGVAPAHEPKPVAVAPAPAPRPEVHRPWMTKRRKAGIGVLAAGVAVGIVGVGFLAAAPGMARNSANADSLSNGQAQYNRATAFNAAGYGLIGVGAAAAVAGIVVMALPTREAPLHAWISPTGFGIRGEW